MLKNKKAIYILIPLNIAIWGFFIYRIYSAYTSVDDVEITTKQENIKLDDLKDSVAYKLTLNYQDPFLKEGEKLKSHSNQTIGNLPKKENKVVVVKTPTIPLVKQIPEIKYLGLIKNNSSGAATALVNINGQSKLIKANDIIDGFCFKSFSNENLTVIYGKEKMVITK